MSTHYFIALPIEQQLRDKLEKIQHGYDLRLYKHHVYPEDFHVTMAFLGQASEEQLLSLHNGLQNVVENFRPFNIEIERIAGFGSKDQPRVLFAEVKINERLEQLHRKVVAVCSTAGFVSDQRAYRPHITLAKKWRFSDRKIASDWPVFKSENQEVYSLKLYKVAPNEKPRYQCVESYAFNEL
ncbi:RNA 2',3'-cyclic phosphodiesterase [Pseudalkalibacillus hwajinpoensis]|uniref:RNA 2',3'-cyclic phosphodiesterase n=1 Tax=Guptibacillus hwajinpoensis TaxID=208199 RepID=UPI00325B8D89